MDISTLRERSYTPYSKAPSVAVVRSRNGRWFPGVRIENVAYPLSISAVQNALFCCLSEGDRPEVLFTDHPGASMNALWQEEFDFSIQSLEANSIPDSPFADLALPPDIHLKNRLHTLLDDALVDESDFPVSALLETENGYYSGVNIECSAWNLGLCAERIAIAKALTYSAKKLKSLHVHTREGKFSSPCGACRQVIIEHLPNKQVHLHHADHSKSVHFSNDLLPHCFSSSTLSNK